MSTAINQSTSQSGQNGHQDTDFQELVVGQSQPENAPEAEANNEPDTMDATVESIAIPSPESTWKIWIAKLLFTVISLKAWGLIASMAVTSWLVIHRSETVQMMLDKGVDPTLLENISVGITGAQWMTFNLTIWTMLYGIKEVKKVAEKNRQEKAEANNG